MDVKENYLLEDLFPNEMNAAVSFKATRTNIDVAPVTNVNIHNESGNKPIKDVQVEYDPHERLPEDSYSSISLDNLTHENQLLKLYIGLLNTHPTKMNNEVVTYEKMLICIITEAIKSKYTFSQDLKIRIDSDETDTGCCATSTVKSIETIYVTIGTQTKNLKYNFPDIIQYLKDLGISYKYLI
jgi:hypothetical protein